MTYLLTLRMATVAYVPIIGQVRSVTESRAILEVEEGVATHKTCAVHVDAEMGKTRLSEGFLGALPELQYPFEPEGKSLELDMGEVAVGYDPELGFPNHLGHPGVLDSDQDEAPGVSIILEIPLLGQVTLLVAQRTRSTLRGVEVEPGVWRGQTSFADFEQVILGSDHKLLSEPPPLTPTLGDFILRELPGPLSCDELLAR